MKNVTDIILNGITLPMFIACYIVGLCGFILSIAGNVKKGINNPDNSTPTKFDWGVFFSENWLRIMQNIIGLAVGIILAKSIVGQEITVPLSLAIGAGIDRLIISKIRDTATNK